MNFTFAYAIIYTCVHWHKIKVASGKPKFKKKLKKNKLKKYFNSMYLFSGLQKVCISKTLFYDM